MEIVEGVVDHRIVAMELWIGFLLRVHLVMEALDMQEVSCDKKIRMSRRSDVGKNFTVEDLERAHDTESIKIPLKAS